MTERPFISNDLVGDDSSPEEAFQNTVLRPIIKMKHDLLIAFTKHYIGNKKQNLASFDLKKKLQFVNTCFEQDNGFRSEIRGMIIGQFNVDEYAKYTSMTRAINRRIVNIIKERMIDHLDLICH